MINSFTGTYYFLSNFYSAEVIYDGVKYLNNEAAFQAQKCTISAEKLKFKNLNPSDAKRLGRHVQLRSDWELVKEYYMFAIVMHKFQQNNFLLKLLLSTNNEELIEGNTWRDTYWGVCNGIGKNKLGKILMEVRRILREEIK